MYLVSSGALIDSTVLVSEIFVTVDAAGSKWTFTGSL
jgi:hypothetical protein